MPKRRKVCAIMAAACIGALAMVSLSACSGTSPAAATSHTSGMSGIRHSIPSSSHRPPDPSATPGAGGEISAAQAPLSQLWALAQGDPPAADQTDPHAWAISDFADAVVARCYPQLTSDQRADLTARYSAFLAAQSAEPAVVADLRSTKNAYFAEATRLCM